MLLKLPAQMSPKQIKLFAIFSLEIEGTESLVPDAFVHEGSTIEGAVLLRQGNSLKSDGTNSKFIATVVVLCPCEYLYFDDRPPRIKIT